MASTAALTAKSIDSDIDVIQICNHFGLGVEGAEADLMLSEPRSKRNGGHGKAERAALVDALLSLYWPSP